MRGLLMALFALDFPGHAAGSNRARENSVITKTSAKTTSKATTGKTV